VDALANSLFCVFFADSRDVRKEGWLYRNLIPCNKKEVNRERAGNTDYSEKGVTLIYAGS